VNLITKPPIDHWPQDTFSLRMINIGKLRTRGIEFHATVTPTLQHWIRWEINDQLVNGTKCGIELGGGLEAVCRWFSTGFGTSLFRVSHSTCQGYWFRSVDDNQDSYYSSNGLQKPTADLVILG